jgi:replicative DNA helicase
MSSDVLPHSADAETTILGVSMAEAMQTGGTIAIDEALAILDPPDFYSTIHRTIFESMASLRAAGQPVTVPLVAEDLKRGNALQRVGGTPFLINLTVGMPVGSIVRYAAIVRDRAALRELKRLVETIDTEASEASEPATHILARAQEAIFNLNLRTQLSEQSTVRSYGEVAKSVLEMFASWQRGEVVAVSTGIPELDAKLGYGGLAATDLIVVAARTSFGKTALALQIALNAARSGVPVLIFSLEMSRERLFIRNLSSTSQVAHFQISPWTFQNNPNLSDRIVASVPQLSDLPIYVDSQTRKLSRLLSVAREWHRRLTPDQKRRCLLITDYMQLVDNQLDKRSRNDEVGGISMGLKGVANELSIPVIGVSQLNRSPAKEKRRPELSDLRESGQLEQDADCVLFPWSEEDITDEPIRSMRLYCPKNRNAKPGWEIPVDFDGEHQWFSTEQMYAQERGEKAAALDFNAD